MSEKSCAANCATKRRPRPDDPPAVIAMSASDEAIQTFSLEGFLDCSHGDGVCQGGWPALCSIAGQLFVPTTELQGWRAQVKSRPVRRTAAERLGLDLIEHAIRLMRSDKCRSSGLSRQRSKVRAGFGNLVCLPDQTHIRSSRGATAPQFRLRRAGSRGRDHSSLRLLKPCNPSVRPPGSAEADRASAD
jgi:hypothetical protein